MAAVYTHNIGMNDRSNSLSFVLPPQRKGPDFIAGLSIYIVLAINILVLAGWIFDIAALKSIHPDWTPMRIVAAICLALSALSLLCLRTEATASRRKILAIPLAILVGILGITTSLTYVDEFVRGHKASVASTPFLELFLEPTSRMAMIAALSFVVLSAVFILLAIGSRYFSGIAHGLALPVAAVSYLILVGYAFDVSALYQWMNSTIPLSTAISLSLLCLSVFSCRTDTWLTEVLTSGESGGMMVRRMLLPLLVLPTVIGWLRYQGELAGYFPSAVGVALVAIVYTFLILGLMWFTARSINRVDAHRRAGEKALSESEQRLRSILDALPVAIFLGDPSGNIVFTNPAVEQIWGMRTHVTRDHYGEYQGVWFENRKPVAPDEWALSHTLETHQPFENELIEIGGSPENSKIVHTFAIPIRDASGSFLGAVVVAEDVTQQIRAQEQTRAAKETAEKAAVELARSNRDLEQFAYVSSHDLQEPLRMVTGFMRLLQTNYGGKLDATANKYIHFAVDGSKRMERLINDLLAYSRVGMGDAELSPVEMERVLDQALANLSISIQESRAQIIREPLPTLRADGQQMLQIFQNLIGNAIKFRAERTPIIQVAAARENQSWVFSIKDNGIGIAPEFQSRVFLIFQRLHTADKYPGTGIGLAICRKIIDRHNGRIWIESTPGQGSNFYFSLPA